MILTLIDWMGGGYNNTNILMLTNKVAILGTDFFVRLILTNLDWVSIVH